jgi:hypothetical protein
LEQVAKQAFGGAKHEWDVELGPYSRIGARRMFRKSSWCCVVFSATHVAEFFFGRAVVAATRSSSYTSFERIVVKDPTRDHCLSRESDD